VLVALLAALTPLVVLRGARAAGLGRGAWVAAWLVGTGLLHLQFSVQERPWAPMVFFLALAVWPAALYVRAGGLGRLLLSGLAAAGAFSCHQAGLFTLLVPGLAWLLGPPGWRGKQLLVRVENGVFCVALFALVSLCVGHPYLLLYGSTPDAAVSGAEVAAGGAVGGVVVGGQGFHYSFSADSLLRLGRALLGYDPVLVVLGLLGLLASLRVRALLPATLFLLLWSALFLTSSNDHVRYLLPVCVLAAYPAGLACERLLQYHAAWLALLPLLVLPLVQAGRLVQLLRRDDTRALAEERLARDLPAAAVLAVDRYGPALDLSAGALERLASWRELRVREGVRAALLAELAPDELQRQGLSPGRDALFLEELIAIDERARSWTARELPGESSAESQLTELLAGRGATHVLLSDRGGGRWNPLAEELAAHPAAPLWEIDCAAAGSRVERMLPLELDFALTDIWRVSRAGPRLVLFKL